MFTLFQSGSNTATNGTAIGTSTGAVNETDIRIFKMIVGAPVTGGNIWLYNISNPLNASTANIAMKYTFGTASESSQRIFDFGPKGLPLNEGGNIIIDQTMQVTLIWGVADDAQT